MIGFKSIMAVLLLHAIIIGCANEGEIRGTDRSSYVDPREANPSKV
jgi:hypothetical protein